MFIIPSIDLKDGRCVRLKKGEMDTVHKVAEDALETAMRFEAEGAEYLHMVDLDGAFHGDGKNYDIVGEIAARCGMKIELGGGLRDMETLNRADAMGVHRMVIGSAAVGNPEYVAAAVQKYGDRIAVGIDAQKGTVKTAGWVKNSGVHFLDFAVEMEAIGVKYIIFTDIDTDGMLSGPSLNSIQALRQRIGCRIIASGGVSCVDDLMRLKEMDLHGAIIGKAIYTGDISLREAVEQCR